MNLIECAAEREQVIKKFLIVSFHIFPSRAIGVCFFRSSRIFFFETKLSSRCSERTKKLILWKIAICRARVTPWTSGWRLSQTHTGNLTSWNAFGDTFSKSFSFFIVRFFDSHEHFGQTELFDAFKKSNKGQQATHLKCWNIMPTITVGSLKRVF